MTYSLNTLNASESDKPPPRTAVARFGHEIALIVGILALVFWLLSLAYGLVGSWRGSFLLPSLLSGLGSLMGEGDRRASVGANFTRLQQFTVGVSYNAYLGDPHFRKRPYADRDFAAFTMKYLF